jgi:hypothetical protein
VLWLDSEHWRILAQRGGQQWLYPMYHLAGCIASVAGELEESLECEHNDYRELIAGRV